MLIMVCYLKKKYAELTRLGPVPYFPDMSGWTSGPIFSGEVRFFPDIDRGTSGGDFENYAEPMFFVVINVILIIKTTFNAHNN